MPLVPVLRPGERTKGREGRDFQSNRRKSARRKRAEERGWDGWSPGESGENKSGGLLRRAVRDGCYEFDCPPAGPSLPLVSPAIFHPVFRFFAVSLSSPSKYLPSYPCLSTPRGHQEELALLAGRAKPLQIKSSREFGRMGGINFSLVAPAAFGDDPGRAWGKPVRRPITDRPARFKGDAPLCRPNKGDRWHATPTTRSVTQCRIDTWLWTDRLNFDRFNTFIVRIIVELTGACLMRSVWNDDVQKLWKTFTWNYLELFYNADIMLFFETL